MVDPTLRQILSHLFELSTEVDRLAAENERLTTENAQFKRALDVLPVAAVDPARSVPNDQKT